MFTVLVDEWVDEQTSNLSPEKENDLPYISQQTSKSGRARLQASLCSPGAWAPSQQALWESLKTISSGFTSQVL